MDRKSIFTKTAKGLMEATGKTSILSRGPRNLLKEIDGKLTVAQVNDKLPKLKESEILEMMKELVKDGFIKEFVSSEARAAAPAPAAAPSRPASAAPAPA